MMKKRTLLSTLMLSIVSIGLFIGCGTNSETAKNKEGEQKTYEIACDSKYAPFSFEKDNKYEGIDVELLEAIAKEEGFEYNLKPMEFSAVIPGLKSGLLDGAIAGIGMTDERKQALDFSKGYYEAGLAIVTSSDNNIINGESDLNGKTVAIKKGTAGAIFAEENQEKYNLKLSYLEDSPTMFLDVENNNSDFLLEDYPVIAYKINNDKDSKLKIVGNKVTTVDFGFAVDKGKNSELLKMFDEGLEKIKQNGKYDEIVGKYVGSK